MRGLGDLIGSSAGWEAFALIVRRLDARLSLSRGRAEQLGGRESDIGVEVEEGVEAALELGFDFFAGSVDDVHGDVGFVAGGQLEGGVLDFGDLAFREEPETVD